MKFRNVFSTTLKRITKFIQSNHQKEIQLTNDAQIDLFKKTIKKSLGLYAGEPLLKVISKPVEQAKTPSTTTTKIASLFGQKTRSMKDNEAKEIQRIYDILEGEGKYNEQGQYTKGPFNYNNVDDLRIELERHFILQEKLNEFPGSHLGDAIAATLDAFYTHVILPNELATASDIQTRNALTARIDAVINFYTATHKNARYRGYRELINSAIAPLNTKTAINDFVSAWLENKKTDQLNAAKALKKKLPRSLRQELTKEFRKFQRQQVPVGEFYEKIKTDYTLLDYMKYALDTSHITVDSKLGKILMGYSNPEASVYQAFFGKKPLNQQEKREIIQTQMIRHLRLQLKSTDFQQHPKLVKNCKLALKMYAKDYDQYTKMQKIKAKRHLKTHDQDLESVRKDKTQNEFPRLSRAFMTKQWWPMNKDGKLQPKNELKGIIIGVHGWRAHKEYYADLARQAQKQGYLFIAYDQRGWGETKERKKYGLMGDSLRLDFRKFVSQIEKEYPNTNLGIVGHSLGGAIPSLEMDFIEQMSEERIKLGKNPISLRLIAPAFAGTTDIIKSNLDLKTREAMPEKMKMTREDPRFYKVFPNLKHSYIVKFLATATPLTNLMKEARGAMIQQFSKEGRHTRVHIDGFESDNAVAHSIFVNLKNKLKPNHEQTEDKVTEHNITIQTKAGYGHDAHLERFCGPYNKEIIDDFDTDFGKTPSPAPQPNNKGGQREPTKPRSIAQGA